MADWPEGIDVEAMLAPIPGDVPVGADLREDTSARSPYFRLRDARNEARDTERRRDSDPSVDEPTREWRTVRELAVEALTNRTKDLEIAAWLTEALIRSEGPLGLAAGARIIAGLADAYWDTLYPMPDDYGMETRVAPVAGLNGTGGEGTLAQTLRKFALFNRADGSPMQFWQYKASVDVNTLMLSGGDNVARAKQRLAAGVLPLDTVETEARAAGQAHFGRQRRLLRTAHREWVAMGEVLDAKAGSDSPPTSAVRNLLTDILEIIDKYGPSAEAEAEAAAETEAATAAAAPDGSAPVGGAGFVPRAMTASASREDMLKELARIAEWFRKSEPQSPLAYTLQEAIRRGRMSWPELLAEVVADAATRDGILMQLGIRPPQPEEGG